MGSAETGESYTETYKAEIYEEVKKELSKNSPDDWMESGDDYLMGKINDSDASLYYKSKRPQDDLLKEFGW